MARQDDALSDRPCPHCGSPPDEVARLLRENQTLKQWLRQAYKQKDTPARRARRRPRMTPIWWGVRE